MFVYMSLDPVKIINIVVDMYVTKSNTFTIHILHTQTINKIKQKKKYWYMTIIMKNNKINKFKKNLLEFIFLFKILNPIDIDCIKSRKKK